MCMHCKLLGVWRAEQPTNDFVELGTLTSRHLSDDALIEEMFYSKQLACSTLTLLHNVQHMHGSTFCQPALSLYCRTHHLISSTNH